MSRIQDTPLAREAAVRPGEDSALREDIRRLGRLLGDVLRTHEGTALYESVE
jgi:phosphoenolpyruvate carboxylase